MDGGLRGLRSKACFLSPPAHMDVSEAGMSFFASSNCSYSSQLHFLPERNAESLF